MHIGKDRLRAVVASLWLSIVGTASAFAAAPTLANLAGDSVSWANVGNNVLLDAGSDALPGDADFEPLNGGAGDWGGATLVVQRAGSAVPGDVFGIYTTGASFTVNGANLQTLSGLTFGFINSSGSALGITFAGIDAIPTTALVTDVVRRITYRRDSAPGDFTVRFTLGDGTQSATADVSVIGEPIFANGFE